VWAIPSNERHRLRAALEVGANDIATTRSRLADLLSLAAVVADELVGEFDAAADGQDIVAHAVNA
jgi:hypothetical protein